MECLHLLSYRSTAKVRRQSAATGNALHVYSKHNINYNIFTRWFLHIFMWTFACFVYFFALAPVFWRLNRPDMNSNAGNTAPPASVCYAWGWNCR